MIEQLFIAEKPSLAQDVAGALGEIHGVTPRRAGGYWEVGDRVVVWLFGHMYELAQPHHYNERFRRWDVSDLPIVPDPWKLLPAKDKREQIERVQSFIKQARTIVNVGDAAREGQLLVDELLLESNWDPFNDKTYRLWIKSMTRNSLIESIKGMFPNKEKKNLYHSAVCRQRADFLFGINLSRFYTILARRSGADLLLSVGRVQTPTLKLVVDRDREIENFKPTDHFLPTGLFVHEEGKFTARWIIPPDYEGVDSEDRLIDKEVARKVCEAVAGKTGKVLSFDSKTRSKSPPLPYSLSALQTECSSKFGLSAKQTLEVAQALYEKHKVATYPRSDSRYLPLAVLKEEAASVMKAMVYVEGLEELAKGADMSLKSPAWNDAKVSDHHAIIPTTEVSRERLMAMSDIERKVFGLIARAFVAQFYPNFQYQSLSAMIAVDEHRFRGTGRRIVDQGWKVVYGASQKDEDEDEDDQTLPTMGKGDPVMAEKVDLVAKRTSPPPRFTDGTLIDAMAHIHKFVSNPEIKKRLKENEGLGTEATRADIIETLFRRQYIKRQKKYIISTDIGRSTIDGLPAEVTDPGLTAIWESYLEKVSSGELSPEKFLDGQIASIKKRIETGATQLHIKGVSIEPLPGTGEPCPACGKGQMVTRRIGRGDLKGQRVLACNGWRKDDPNSCKHAVWPDRPKNKEKVEPLEGHGKPCAKCGKGTMVTRVVRKGDHKGKKFLSCNNWKQGDPDSCNNSIWPDRKSRSDSSITKLKKMQSAKRK